jgi:decaprenylphospho-beta-D-erythro-pentofuranosid-2-ulose 2-reductase
MSYVLIIGARSDMAKALARTYARHGFDLYLAARDSASLEDFANDVKVRSKGDVVCLELDILDFDSHAAFYDQLKEKPAGVISAIGYMGQQNDSQSDFSEVMKVVNTNFLGIVSLFDIIASDLEQRKAGFIIGISSVAGDRGRKSNYYYGSAKAAFTSYLSGLRNRLHDADVHVMTVKPGFVATSMTKGMDLPEKLTAQPDEVARDIYKAHMKGKDVLYTKWIWRWIMLIIRSIPEWKFKRMSI